MTARYVGQAGDGLWAAGTSSAKYPISDLDEYGYPDLSSALTAANSGDTILLQPGTYSIPSITMPLTIKGQDRNAVFIGTATIAGDNVLIDSVNITGAITVSGSCGFVQCKSNLDIFAIATGAGAIATAGCQGNAVAETGRAAATNYPFIRQALGGGGRYGTRPRTWVTVQAPATRRPKIGHVELARWIRLGRTQVRMEERTANETTQARLLLVEATGRCLCRSGFPISNEFRLLLDDGRALEVRSAKYLNPPDSELEILYSEVSKG